MNLTTPQAILLAAAVLALLFIIHRFFPASAVAKAEDVAIADAKKAAAVVRADLPDVEADAMAALSRGMAWLTDTTAEVAAKAKADASIAKKNALKAQAAAALAASSTTPPAA